MRMDALPLLFSKAIRLESPWEIKRVVFSEQEGRVELFIDFPIGSFFSCPKCKELSGAYDTTERRWRHLSFFEYACYLVVKVPRIHCRQDGILKIEFPWARDDSDSTFLFASLCEVGQRTRHEVAIS